jgi:hypothetical protein
MPHRQAADRGDQKAGQGRRDIAFDCTKLQCERRNDFTIVSKTRIVLVAAADQKTFKIKIKKNFGVPLSFSVEFPKDLIEREQQSASEEPENEMYNVETPFREVIKSFQRSMSMYFAFIPYTFLLGPVLAANSLQKKVVAFTQENGLKREDLSSEEEDVYEVEFHDFIAFRGIMDDIRIFNEGSKHIPIVMLVGLISTYDSYLSQLLEAVFKVNPDAVSASDKTMTFSELTKFASIEEARNSIVTKEIETLMRDSHHEQFDAMEKRFGMKLREGLSIWPNFIEVCERRNLFTHTGGVVSGQYIKAGVQHNFSTTNINIGDTLTVDANYLRESVNIIYEIGAKLGYVLWRKFDGKKPLPAAAADQALNDLCYELICKKQYTLADKILKFGVEEVTKRKGREDIRKRMVVNRANACRLGGDKNNATNILDLEDWSAADERFQLCVAAVRENAKEVAAWIRKIGPNGSMKIYYYKEWPVFRGVDTDENVRSALRDVFGKDIWPSLEIKGGDDKNIVLH